MNEISKVDTRSAQPAMLGANMLFNGEAFAQGQRVANLFANSQLVPQHLRGKVADCFIALHIANRMGEDPLTVMQNIYIVSGKAGWSAQYMIARARTSGAFKGGITWDVAGEGDGLAVTAKAVLASSGEQVAIAASMKMAKAEGWTKNQKYMSMPELMLRYRSATLLIRLYAPEVMLGMQTIEEVEDVNAARGPENAKDITPPRPTADQFRVEPDFEVREVADSDEKAAGETTIVEDGTSEPEASFTLTGHDGQVLEYVDYKDFVRGAYAEMNEAAKGGEKTLAGWRESNSLEGMTPEDIASIDHAIGEIVKAINAKPADGGSKMV